MATGTLPFRGESSGVIQREILDSAPVAAVRMNPDLPAELERIINKALEKDRDLRYQHAADMRADLKRLSRETGSSHAAASSQTEAAPGALLSGHNTSSQSGLTAAPGSGAAHPAHSSSSAVVTAAKQHKFGLAAGSHCRAGCPGCGRLWRLLDASSERASSFSEFRHLASHKFRQSSCHRDFLRRKIFAHGDG